MAELYLAQQTGAAGFSKIVALKRILPHLAADPTFTQMFQSEAKLASDLGHPHLAHVLDFGESEGEHFLTMEYVHGANLLQTLDRARAALPLEAALTIVVDVARGLHELHEHRAADGRALGLVHRDVSPSNVLLAYDGSVKLTDFGIAKAMELTSATRTGTFKGKLGHSSPEQARGESIDRRSDVFCLGILLYEVTTGVRAFAGPNEFAVLGKVARAAYDPPETLVDDYPEGLSALVEQALSADPAQRPATAAAFAESVATYARDAGLALGPSAVAAVMHDLFGKPPAITDPDELERVSTVIPASTHNAPPTRRPWMAYALVPVALAIGAVGAWSLRAPASSRTAATVLSMTPAILEVSREPVARATPAVVPDTPNVDPTPEDDATAAPEPATKSPKPRKRRRGRKPRPTKKAGNPSTDLELKGALFPPEP